MDFDFNDGEDSDFEGEGVHSLLPRASLGSVEDSDRNENGNGDKDTHSDGDDGELDRPCSPSPGDSDQDPSSSKSVDIKFGTLHLHERRGNIPSVNVSM